MTVIPNPPSLGDTFLNEVTGVTYEYDGEKWIVIKTPGSEEAEQISEDLAALTSRVSDGETVQGQIQETVTDALVTQSDIQGDIDALETKVEALEGTVTDGTWRFTSRGTPLQGEFDLLDGTGNKINGNWSLAQFIYFTNPDFLSVNHTFEFLGLEDYIRIGGTGGSAVYRVKSGKTGTDSLVEYQVEHISSNGTVFESIAYDFEFTPGFDPTAYATKSYVDDVADTKVDLTGENEITTAWRIKTAAKSFISITTNEMKLYHVADPTSHDDHWAANKGYVDTEVGKVDTKIDSEVETLDTKIDTEAAKKVNKVGDSMTGRLDITVPNESNAAIRTKGIINVKKANQDLGGENNFSAGPSYVRVFTTPSGPNDVVTKEFLDTELSNFTEPDLSGYLRKSEFYHYNRAPAVLSWKFDNTSSGSSAPADQYFKITDNGGDKYFRLSFKTANGADLGNAAFSDTNVSIDNGPVGTVWYWNYPDENWRLKEQFRINTWRWNYNNHFEFRTSSRHGNKSYTPGTAYYITVGGFF